MSRSSLLAADATSVAALRNTLQRLATDRAGIVDEDIQIWHTIADLIHEVLKALHRQEIGRNRVVLRFGGQPVNAARDVRVIVFRRGSSEKEQPLRLRKVAGLSPALGSNILQIQSVHVTRCTP